MIEEVRIRAAVAEDAEGITRTYLDSAEHHAALDPARYLIPSAEATTARYRDGRQHPGHAASDGEVVTLVAEFTAGGAIVGFVDARLERSSDAMHREIVYCHVAEIAVHREHRSRGIGEDLLRAAEEWGRQHGAEFASLEYHAANDRAAAFYRERMGYRVAAITAIKRISRRDGEPIRSGAEDWPLE